MYNILRTISCIIAVICVAVAIFIFVYFGMGWGFLCVGIALVFVGLMFLFRHLNNKKELAENPPPPVGDFITGRVPVAKAPGDDDVFDMDEEQEGHTFNLDAESGADAGEDSGNDSKDEPVADAGDVAGDDAADSKPDTAKKADDTPHYNKRSARSGK